MAASIGSIDEFHRMLGTLVAAGTKFTGQEELLITRWGRLLRDLEVKKEEFREGLLDIQMEFGTAQFLVITYRSIVEKNEKAAREKKKRKVDEAFGRVEQLVVRSLNCDDEIVDLQNAIKKLKRATLIE
jgi:hypothetical protein